MEFRQDCKELRGRTKKVKDLNTFKDRASMRVNLCYTKNIIMSGNQYQRQVNLKNKKENFANDGQATSAIGFIGHLNTKLQEMSLRGNLTHTQDSAESKQLTKLVNLQKRFEACIGSETMPLKHYEVLTASSDQLQAKECTLAVRENNSSEGLEIRTGANDPNNRSEIITSERTSSYAMALQTFIAGARMQDGLTAAAAN